MEKIKIKIDEGASIPAYQTVGAAGFDLVAHSFKKVYKGQKEVDLSTSLTNSIQRGYVLLRPFERVLIGTGLYMEIPEGHELQIRSRSGHALKKGIVVGNQPGTVDEDYRGEIMVILINTTQFLVKVELGERIAQGVLSKYEKAEFDIVDNLSDTIRGEGGYGHTGTGGPVKFG